MSTHLVVNVKQARWFSLAAPAAGAYGAAQQVAVTPGLYRIFADDVVAIRFVVDSVFRVDGTGAMLEVPVTPAVPVDVLIDAPCSLASRNTACVAWVVPLLAFDDATGHLRKVQCAL
jgi:hypothetical protein